jgi:hypothetical protein
MTILIILLLVVLGLGSAVRVAITYSASLRQRLIYHLSTDEVGEVTSQPQPCRILLGVIGKGRPAQVCIVNDALKIDYEDGESSTLAIRDLKKIEDSSICQLIVYPQSSKALALNNDGHITITFSQPSLTRTFSLFKVPESKADRAADRIAVAFYLRAKEIRGSTTI